MTQETVYRSLLRRQRQAFHQQVAEAIEVLYADGLDELYEQLAYHFDRAGATAKAIEYLVKAGQKAAAQFANAEAITHFDRALELAGDGPARGVDSGAARRRPPGAVPRPGRPSSTISGSSIGP